MSHGAALYEKRNHVGYITLNRPDRGNASNWEMVEDLDDIYADVRKDEDVWGVIVTAAGERHFCTGLDQREMGEGFAAGERRPVRMAHLPEDLWKPVITAVNGVVAGGGLFFVTGCDFSIGAEHATFLEPHVSVGWVPVREMIGLATRMALGPVMRMAMVGTAERMDAQRAYELGLLTEVVPLSRLIPRSTEVMEMIFQQSPTAVAATKEMLHKAYHEVYAKHDALLTGHAIRDWAHRHPDYQEGPKAFAQRRKPEWQFPAWRGR